MEKKIPASPAELTEYALALRHLGAQREAEAILSDPVLAGFPQAVLARGFLNMHKWEYAAALQDLELYLSFTGIGEYEKRVARVNRLACLNYLATGNLEPEFESLRQELEQAGHSLLLANTLEIYAQSLAQQERWEESRDYLLRAKKQIDANSGRSSLYIDKWLSLQGAFAKKSEAEILAFRVKAAEQRDWETLRDLDYNLAKIRPESFWADRAFYGSPYVSFRLRMRRIRDFPTEKWLCESGSPSIRLDPWFVKDIEDSLTHRLLVSLLSDLYKPQTVGSLYSVLYPDEYFDPDVASKRIRQLIKRLREWLVAHQISAELIHDKGLYSLKLHPDFGWLARARSVSLDPARFFLERYQQSQPQTRSSDEWAQVLGLSKDLAQRKLREAESAGLVARKGNARYLMYTLRAA